MPVLALQAADESTAQAPVALRAVVICADDQAPARQLPQELSPLMYLGHLHLADGSRKPLLVPLKIEVDATESDRISVYAPAVRLGGVGDDFLGAVVDLSDGILGLAALYGSRSQAELDQSAQEELRALRLFIAE